MEAVVISALGHRLTHKDEEDEMSQDSRMRATVEQWCSERNKKRLKLIQKHRRIRKSPTDRQKSGTPV